jgi:Clp amino terminal domain, pathogenicity island component
MTGFPVPLDNLIAYVKALHPEGGPLAHLSDAVTVAARVEEQSDALIGHFVDQARRSGASWSQIGASMGVSKQAAQKRFVDRDLLAEGTEPFSRFTLRARNMLATAGLIAAAAGAESIRDTDIAVSVPSQPAGLAATIVHRAGVTDEQLHRAFAVEPPAGTPAAEHAALEKLSFDASGKDALKGALKSALRLGHNYLGTEHLLLGVLFAGGPAAQTLNSLGLSVENVETALAEEIRKIQEGREAQQS